MWVVVSPVLMSKAQNNRAVGNQAAAGDAIQTPIDYPRPGFPVPKRHICKVVPSPSPILRKLPTSKSSPCVAVQHQALVWTTHGIVVQPLDSSIAASQRYVVKSRYGESTPAIIEGGVLSIDELRSEFVDLRGRNSVSRECVRVVDKILQLAVL